MTVGSVILANGSKRCIVVVKEGKSLKCVCVLNGSVFSVSEDCCLFLRECTVEDFVQAFENASDEGRNLLSILNFSYKPMPRDVKTIFVSRVH